MTTLTPPPGPLPSPPTNSRSRWLRRGVWLTLALGLWLIAAAPAVASPSHGNGHGHGDTAAEEEEPSNRPPTYDLEKIIIKNYRPIEHEQLTIKLMLHIEVAKENQAAFEALWPQYQHRIRSQVITATRLVPPHEFDDPELHLLRRLIYLRLRRVLPELPVSQVYVSEFGYMVE